VIGTVAMIGTALAACADDGPPADPWATTVSAYLDAACTSPCVSGSEAQCRSDVGEELGRAMIALADPKNLMACEACLQVKTTELGVIDTTTCMPTSDQTAMVLAVCDTDPTADSDGDGDPTDDFSEACGGVP
jgi:hypothetical protein